MKTKISDELYEYALSYSGKEHPILNKISEYNKSLTNGNMQIAKEQAQLMAIIAKMIGAKKYLEIGVFTGYSSLAMALAMGNNATITAIDNNPSHLEIAKKFWQQAIVEKQITTYLGDASEVLEELSTANNLATFDMVFIDANKNDYLNHFNLCYNLVRSGGVIIVDNVLMHGLVLETKPPKYAQAIKEFNQAIYNDSRVDTVMLPFADGVTIAYKK
jgi:caffeoyl-CoA O-methyltransferase